MACSALSLPFYGYFYCVCLLYVVIDNNTIQQVLRSVTKHGIAVTMCCMYTFIFHCTHAGSSLLWAATLGLIIIYIYSVGTFALLPNEFNDPNEDAENILFCRSLIQCFITVLEYGLLDTLGLVSMSLFMHACVHKLITHACYRLQVCQLTSNMLH